MIVTFARTSGGNVSHTAAGTNPGLNRSSQQCLST